MKSIRWGMTLGVCSLIVGYSAARAQPPERSKDFFEKNYAETPLKPRQQKQGGFPDGSFLKPTPTLPGGMPREMTPEEFEKFMRDPKHNPMLQQQGGAAKPSSGQIPGTNQAPLFQSQGNDERDLTGLERAIPVKAIGGILNSLDPEHYQKSLEQLTSLAISRDMNIGTIYAIGDMKVASDTPYMGKIMARGGVVHIVSNIPKGYEVSLSPTWIVKTDEGEVLLEAVGGLDKYFNQRGEFIDREKRKSASPPAKNS